MTSEPVARMLSPVTTPTSVTIFGGSPGLANHHQPSISDSFVQPLSQPSNHVSTWFNIYKTSIFPAFFHIFPSIFQPLITKCRDPGRQECWSALGAERDGVLRLRHLDPRSDELPGELRWTQVFPRFLGGMDHDMPRKLGISYWLVVWNMNFIFLYIMGIKFYFSIYTGNKILFFYIYWE